MASNLSPNLKLRLSTDLTSDSLYNLNRIDALASIFQIDANDAVRVRAITDVQIQPNAPDIGGSGSGGSIILGDPDSNFSLLDIHADGVDFHDAEVSNASIDADSNTITNLADANLAADAAIDATKISSGLISNTEFDYLDGLTGNIQDQLDALGGSNQLVTNWVTADGTTKTINHGFNTFNIMIQVLDSADNYANVDVDHIERPTVNTAVLTSSEAPSSSWVVLLTEIG